MSADVLRRAASRIRSEWQRDDWYWEGRPSRTREVASTWLAVADWLDDQGREYDANEAVWRVSSLDPENRWAERGLTVEANLSHHHGSALAVARAYLGESA